MGSTTGKEEKQKRKSDGWEMLMGKELKEKESNMEN